MDLGGMVLGSGGNSSNGVDEGKEEGIGGDSSIIMLVLCWVGCCCLLSLLLHFPLNVIGFGLRPCWGCLLFDGDGDDDVLCSRWWECSVFVLAESCVGNTLDVEDSKELDDVLRR